ncbi:LLM class oxidoreductase [Viridibacillus arvi]|uniref:LLM class oxidoreductase n=1 Tax=Viridibacillus arvi TaxID=263475 RepID=UPI003CFD58E5
MNHFQSHQGFSHAFKENRLSLGLAFPLEAYTGSTPQMDIDDQIKLAKQAEEYGFAALFVRDAPIYDPNFGDVGFLYDPLMFLTYVAANTKTIALGTSSIVTPLRNPLHLAKSAATLDQLSNQRFLFGTATGDRPIEFPAFKVESENRSALYQESISVMKTVWNETFPQIQTEHVALTHGDIVPKPALQDIPVFGTGYSGQTLEWLAKNTDGWLFYPQDVTSQRNLIQKWRHATDTFKPFIQPITIDLSANPNEAPKPIQGGFRAGRNFIVDYLSAYEAAGVNHIMFGLKYSKRPAAEVIQELGEFVVPKFPAIK